MPSLPARLLLAASALAALAHPAHALEYRSTGRAALLYAQASSDSTRVAIAGSGLPLEIVVDAGRWIKVRAPDGRLAWIEAAVLDGAKSVMVRAETGVVRRQPRGDAEVAFRAARGVLLGLTGPADGYGWLPVRHASGQTGWLPAHEVWGR
jgi:SH3-like domain-containing protein